MADQNRISGLDSMQVAAFLDTGDAAALDAWKREHPDWFVAGDWNHPRHRYSMAARSTTIRREHKQMPADDFSQTPKDVPSRRFTSADEEWWAEKIKPSRQQNLTQLQRDSRAAAYRRLRRARDSSRETQTE